MSKNKYFYGVSDDKVYCFNYKEERDYWVIKGEKYKQKRKAVTRKEAVFHMNMSEKDFTEYISKQNPVY